MNRLRQMSIFAHVVEQQSISKAAEKLDLSKSVISQHLKALEIELGVVLVKRTTRRQTLTPAGEQFYLSCKNLNQLANNAWDEAQQFLAAPQGKIRITAPHAIMEPVISPVIAELIIKYPKLQPELISDDLHLDIMSHNIDLAIRVGQSTDSNIKQQAIGEFRDILCGAKSHLNHDISTLPYIANSWQGQHIKHTFVGLSNQTQIFEQQAHAITNSFHTCLSMIKAGAGIGIIPDFYLKIHQTDLVNLMPDWQLPVNRVYALTPFSTAPLSVKTCLAAIKAKFSALNPHPVN